MDRKTRASSKSPGRSKKTTPKSKSPARPAKSPARGKSPAKKPKSPSRGKSPVKSKSPARRGRSPVKTSKSPARAESEKRSRGRPRKSPSKSPARPKPTARKPSPIKKISPVKKVETKTELKRISPFVKLEEFKPQQKATGQVEVVFVSDGIKYKTSLADVKFRDNLNVGDVREVKWEDGNYYDARVINLMDISRDRSVSLPKASTSSFSEDSGLFRRSNRIKQSELEKMNADVDKILKANNVPLPPQYERKYGEKPVREFGGWAGALLTSLLLPSLILLLQMSCTKSKCKGLNFPSTNVRVYFDLQTAGLYLGYVAWQALLTALPVGKQDNYGCMQVRLSGVYNGLLTYAGIWGLYKYLNWDVPVVLNKSVALLTSAILFSLLVSVALFIKGGRWPAKRNVNADGNKLYDFIIGRELAPTIRFFNIKAWLIRSEFIGIVLLDVMYFMTFNETHASGVYSPTLLFPFAAHILYVLSHLFLEGTFMTSFDAQSEGLGFMSVMASATWPFWVTLVTRYILYSNYQAPTYRLVICSISFALGFFVYIQSNRQKATYRKNPQHPVYSNYDAISTFHGKKLLTGGWWGLVRHPNYVGDIIMQWSIAAVCGLSHWLPYAFPFLHLLILVHRTFRISSRCKNLYGAAWDRYTQLVKHRLVPRVF